MGLLLTDTGTRYEHYSQLLDLWESALESIDSFDSPKTKEKKQQLQAAIEIMRKQIDVLADYDDNRFYLRRMVDAAHTNTPRDTNDVLDSHPDHT